VALLEEPDGEETVAGLAREFIALLNRPFELPNGARAEIGCSIGICLFLRDGDSVDLLLERADAALYQVKRGGPRSWPGWATGNWTW